MDYNAQGARPYIWQKRPNTQAKEAYVCVCALRRLPFMWQKRPNTQAKEAYVCGTRDQNREKHEAKET